MPLFDSLSPEGKILLREAHDRLRRGYDSRTHLVSVDTEGSLHVGIRESMYYALSLLMLDQGWDHVEAICRAVLALQIDAPSEIFHGVFRHHPGEPLPPAGRLDYTRLGLYGRYFADRSWERIAGCFSRKLEADSSLAPRAREIRALLDSALLESVPVVWDTYEPNTREFILMCLAMLLEHGENRLSDGLRGEMAHAVRLGLEGALARLRTGLTPLNTNIKCMDMFLLDYFGARMDEKAWSDAALSLARDVLSRYRKFHSCAEFNSPTYYGVDLSTLGFIRRYSRCGELVSLAGELEEGIWRDAAEFYNPSMRNFCGPYSRAYELELSAHTCFYDMLFWALGEKAFPWHPFSIESFCNPLMLLGDVRIPDDARRILLSREREAVLFHRFRELSERGDPDRNSALCTATGWISPRLMTGALSGSENPSYQLHPLVLFWQGPRGLGTVQLRRCLPDGTMNHLHTVLFDGRADRNRLSMDVQNRAEQDVDVFFEIQAEGIRPEKLTDSVWELPGLTVRLEAHAPRPEVRVLGRDLVRIVYPARLADPESLRMHFDLEAVPADAPA